jgi:hypothetical protein
MELGYKLSSEEFGPVELVEYARRAESAGFGFALASDHYHPWVDAQGQSPFIWSALGAIAQATTRLRLGTEKIREAERAGYTHACIHQVGRDQEGFFRFYEREVLPEIGARRGPVKAGRGARRAARA